MMWLSDTCDFPGNITNGKVLLVGHIGKYEYRTYVQPVGHNDHIQYECKNKEYRLVGPSGSTCVNGTWRPPELPTCQLKHHPHRYYLYPNEQSFVGELRRASLSPRRFSWANVQLKSRLTTVLVTCDVCSLVIKDLVYEAKANAKTWSSKANAKAKVSSSILEAKAWPRGQQDCMFVLPHTALLLFKFQPVLMSINGLSSHVPFVIGPSLRHFTSPVNNPPSGGDQSKNYLSVNF